MKKLKGGLRLKKNNKIFLSDEPIISIITVCFNSEKTIENTILSVINKLSENLEYIIIDGGSTDKTVDIIKKYDDKIDYWVSEHDDGIYDAMNKGACLASEKSYLIWLNSDDILIEVPTINKKYDAFYYNILVKDIYSRYFRILKAKRWKKLSYRSIFFPAFYHQGFILKKEIFMKYKYCLSIGLLADYYLMSIILDKYNCFFVDAFFIEFRTGGAADIANFKKLLSYFKIAKKFNLNISIFMLLNLDRILKIILRKILGRKASLMIRKYGLKFSKTL